MYTIKTFSSPVHSPSTEYWMQDFSLIKKLSSPVKKEKKKKKRKVTLVLKLRVHFQSIGKQHNEDVNVTEPGIPDSTSSCQRSLSALSFAACRVTSELFSTPNSTFLSAGDAHSVPPSKPLLS